MNQRLNKILSGFSRKKILVVGDLVADEYLFGRTSRISREAPVLILKYDSREIGLGGAGNAVNNLVALGAEPIPVGIVGNDEMGRMLVDRLRDRGVDTRFVFMEEGRDTTTKTRILAGESHTIRQQVIRMDRGEYDRLASDSEEKILAALDEAGHGADAVLVSDYQYGVLSPRVIEHINGVAGKGETTVTVDSRYQMLKFRGITALTPNEPEVSEALGLKLTDDPDAVRACGEDLIKRIGSRGVLITRGSKGMMLVLSDGKWHDIPIFGSDEVADVTGAGDTVIAVFTLALTAGASFLEAAQLANVGGGIVVMKRGAATVDVRELQGALSR